MASCGGGSSTSVQSARELALERAQLEQLVHELRAVEPAVAREVAASRRAWPLIFTGLPRPPSRTLSSAVATAGITASPAALAEPSFIAHARTLTGPASGLAGIYESYEQLARRGWLLIEQAVEMTAASGSGASAAAGPRSGASASGSVSTAQANFEWQNSPLYIDAIYDGHFNLSLLGKSLMSGYVKLGGQTAFGSALTQSQVDALASEYSIAAVRLAPHPSAGEASQGGL